MISPMMSVCGMSVLYCQFNMRASGNAVRKASGKERFLHETGGAGRPSLPGSKLEAEPQARQSMRECANG